MLVTALPINVRTTGMTRCQTRKPVPEIETLCPIDRDTRDANGIAVPDISDRELNTILMLISRAKDHRITVILDCCYSGGVGWDVSPPEARTCRGMRGTTIRDMLHVGEENLRRFGCSSIASQDWYPGEDSYVVLAACKPYQFARERWVDGVQVGISTHSLLRVLRSSAETTYEDLLGLFDESVYQTPVIARTHRDTRLWYQNETRGEMNTTSFHSDHQMLVGALTGGDAHLSHQRSIHERLMRGSFHYWIYLAISGSIFFIPSDEKV